MRFNYTDWSSRFASGIGVNVENPSLDAFWFTIPYKRQKEWFVHGDSIRLRTCPKSQYRWALFPLAYQYLVAPIQGVAFDLFTSAKIHNSRSISVAPVSVCKTFFPTIFRLWVSGIDFIESLTQTTVGYIGLRATKQWKRINIKTTSKLSQDRSFLN